MVLFKTLYLGYAIDPKIHTNNIFSSKTFFSFSVIWSPYYRTYMFLLRFHDNSPKTDLLKNKQTKPLAFVACYSWVYALL